MVFAVALHISRNPQRPHFTGRNCKLRHAALGDAHLFDYGHRHLSSITGRPRPYRPAAVYCRLTSTFSFAIFVAFCKSNACDRKKMVLPMNCVYCDVIDACTPNPNP